MQSAQSVAARPDSERGSLSTLERGEYRPVPDGMVPPARCIGHRRAAFAIVLLAVVLVGALVMSSRPSHAGAAAPRPESAAIAHESLDFAEVSPNQWNANGTDNQSAASSESLAASATVQSTTTTTTSTTTTSTTTTATTTTTTTSTTTTTTTDLKPDEDRHDGNVCEDSEELFAGLCYKTCSNLTEGEYPIRSTPFSCCKSRPCLYTNEKAESTVPCEGYDVNGKGGCPHAPGACLVDEEYFLGFCYKRCSILTNGSYPYRKAALTCCKQDGVGCLNPFNDWTSGAFNVGGGRGDNDTSTPRGVHGPIGKLTESSKPKESHMSPHRNVLNITGADLVPHEHMHDGNVCEDNEELLAGLCYKKCANLTDGEYPVRGTAFSCCRSHPCGLINQKADGFVPCSGYDVGGRGGCPHFPGACLKDEELLLGICYAKCSLLTDGAFPHRAAAATCCKDTNLMECMTPFSGDAQTSAAFDVSGGKDDHNASTPSVPHGPMQALTEVA